MIVFEGLCTVYVFDDNGPVIARLSEFFFCVL